MVDISKKVIPIFIIVKDRITVLKKSIESYLSSIKTPIKIVIHDNGTTFPETIKYLNELEKKGIKVYRRTKKSGNKNDELNAVGDSINDWFKTNKSPYYVVTDPDIELDNVNGDILEFYAHCLEKLKISVVGPVLRTDDLPDCYALKQNVIKHENKFLKREHKTIEWKGKEYDFIVAPIDTTFGLYSSKFKFKRHQEGIRLFDPYSARHLDWYLDSKNFTEDHKYYKQKCKFGIRHWG